MLVAGTATPRPETWLELPRLELPRRVDGRRMPPVQLVDMREADPRSGPLHADTWAALEEVRAAGAKAIVMINRRGFAPWLTCRSCGHHWGCPNCDVSLIVHRHSGRLVCHHCAHAEPAPRACPECASTTLSRAGAGTERIEALLRERLAPMPVFRLDSDTAAARGAHARILARFGEAPSAVLVGTQMVAKGHDFPEVTLSAILDADATLRFPDFRAEERTFAMVAQLAGRSGRGEAGGEVIVQTLAPEASSIEHAARHDSAGFLAGELERRRILRYPPFSHLVRIGFSSEQEARLETAAATLARGAARGPARRLGAARPGADVPRPQPPPPPDPDQGRPTARGRSPRCARRSSGAPPTAPCARSRSASTSTRSEPRDRASRRGALRLDRDERSGRHRRPSARRGEEQRELESELLERREAALAHVVKFGDPVLKSKASPVANFGPELRAEVERMAAIMRDGLGVGLAATQLGVLRRLLVFQAGPDGEPTALVNPEYRVALRRGGDRPRRAASACRGSRSTSSARCTPGSAAATPRGRRS